MNLRFPPRGDAYSEHTRRKVKTQYLHRSKQRVRRQGVKSLPFFLFCEYASKRIYNIFRETYCNFAILEL